MRLRSLRGRLTAAMTALFAVWMLVMCVGLTLYAHHRAVRKAHSELTLMAGALQRYLAQVPASRTGAARPLLADFIDQQHHELATETMVVFAVDRHGAVTERSQRLLPQWPLDKRNDDWQAVSMPYAGRTVVLALHWGRSEDELREQVLILLALSLCATGAVALGSWVLVRRTLSPISLLSQEATLASTDTLRPRLNSPSADVEMLELVATLNDLLKRLGDTAVIRGRFYAAASHELRTPLQALSGHLEVALGRERSAADYRAALEEASSQTRRLISLVHDLLLLNQLDTATSPPPAEVVPLADLCERILHRLAPLSAQRGLSVKMDLAGEGEVIAPPTHADMLFRNILDNALKYATTGGEVRISLREEPQAIKVMVFNSAPATPQLDPEELFEPFFRPEVARHSGSAGNGLGLAICKAIALTNHWDLRLEQDNMGVTVTVTLGRRMDGG